MKKHCPTDGSHQQGLVFLLCVGARITTPCPGLLTQSQGFPSADSSCRQCPTHKSAVGDFAPHGKVSATPADRVALIYAHNDIQARVTVFWDEASPDEWWAASEEDLAKFGHLLPCELTKSGALRPKPNLQDVFNEHPFMLRRFSRLG